MKSSNRKVGLLFDEGGVTVAEIYYRLATRFKHYLIDEFQDTSVLQWQNLYLMVEDALSCGGTLFTLVIKSRLSIVFAEVRLNSSIG